MELLLTKKDDNGFMKTFPQQLMELLSREDTKEFITWMPKSDAFAIVNESSFAEIIPRFFKKTKLSSFKGRLYRWGFKKIKRGLNSGSYFHKLFRRDNPSLCLHIRHNQRGSQQMNDGSNLVSPEQLTKTNPIHDRQISKIESSSRDYEVKPSITSSYVSEIPSVISFPSSDKLTSPSTPLFGLSKSEKPYLSKASSMVPLPILPTQKNLIVPSSSSTTFLSYAKINDALIRARLVEAKESVCRLNDALRTQAQFLSLGKVYMDSNNLLTRVTPYPQPSVQTLSFPISDQQYLAALAVLGRL